MNGHHIVGEALDLAVAALTAWLDSHNRPDREELGLRILKVTEEAGEVADAWLGIVGHNPGGVTGTYDTVAAELADVALTVLVAVSSLGYAPVATLADVQNHLADHPDSPGDALDAVVRDVVQFQDQALAGAEVTAEELGLRIMHVVRQAGPAARAWLGVTGQNPRRGYVGTYVDVVRELAGVGVAALAALASLGYDPVTYLAEHATSACTRIAANTSTRENVNTLEVSSDVRS